jgi:uncharacterized sulfatase
MAANAPRPRRLLAAACLAAGAAVGAAATPLAAAERPNIVVFISDDHGYLDSQVAGATGLRTPNMLRLAERGMTFAAAFAASPSCAPSRAALLTGLVPARNGALFNHQPPREDVKKLPAYLQELGYEVVAFGKVAHYEQAGLYGFDHASHDTFHDDECIPAALDYLDRRTSDRPLCLLVGTNWPHVPWPEVEPPADSTALAVPPTHVDTPETRRWRARYYAAVENMDADLGRVYDAAYAKLGPQTLFIHFSDHGAQWPFGKWNLYDAGMRVPFFVVWPDRVAAGSRCDALVSLVDLVPTLVDAAGGSPPDDLDGRSLLPLAEGRAASIRDALFGAHSGDGRMNQYPMRSVRTAALAYVRNLRPDAEHHSHIDLGKPVDGASYWQSWVEAASRDPAARAKVDRYFRRPPEELYDVAADPLQEHNLAGDPLWADALARRRSQLDAEMARQNDRGLATESEAAAELKRYEQARDAKRAQTAK